MGTAHLLITAVKRSAGSARPTITDADLDVAAIVRGLTPEVEAAIHESAYQVMWDHDFTPLLALKVFDADSFALYQEKGFSFYRQVSREGIAL